LSNFLQCLFESRQFIVEMTHLSSEAELRFDVLCTESRQPRDFSINSSLLNYHRVAGCYGLHFGVSEGRTVNVLDATEFCLASHHLRDKACLGFKGLPHVCIERFLGDVTVNLHLGVLISLPQDTPLALFHVGRTPRCIKMVQCNKALLHVRARSHFLSA